MCRIFLEDRFKAKAKDSTVEDTSDDGDDEDISDAAAAAATPVPSREREAAAAAAALRSAAVAADAPQVSSPMFQGDPPIKVIHCAQGSNIPVRGNLSLR